MPKVSIIIPFNNVENYISECLDSVLNQTLKDIEVICINDASTDGTLSLVKQYAEKDERIKLIELSERKGQGFARNRGIEIATGEYIGFVDSDDFIKRDMYECLYNKAKENDNDITMCQAVEYDDVTGQYIQSDYYSLAPLNSFGDNIFSAEDSKQVILDINVALWNKIYKRSYMLGIGEKFPEGFIYEDLPFFFGTYLPAKRISIVWQEFYMYRINRKNSTMQQFNNKILDRLPMVSLTYEKMKKAHFLDDMKTSLQGWIINDLFHRYSLLKEHYQKEFFFLMKKVFQNLEIENVEDSYWKQVYHFQGYLLVMNNSFEDFNQKVFNEYLDIHKVEDRLRSLVVGSEVIDSKISQVYLDIEKNYKYTEDLVNSNKSETDVIKTNLEEKLSALSKDIDSLVNSRVDDTKQCLSNQTDEKISKVYEEITKNYEYTNELRDASKYEIEEAQKEVLSKVDEATARVNQQTDEKILKVYEEITKNYEYTNELREESKKEIEKKQIEVLSKIDERLTKNYEYTDSLIKERYSSLYDNLKDLSYVVHDNNSSLFSKFVDLEKRFEEKIKFESEETKQALNKIQSEMNSALVSTQNEMQKNVEKIANEITSKLNDIVSDFKNSKQELNEEFHKKEKQLLCILEEQEKRHNDEIVLLKEQMLEMEQRINEKLETPCRKIHNYFANRKS